MLGHSELKTDHWNESCLASEKSADSICCQEIVFPFLQPAAHEPTILKSPALVLHADTQNRMVFMKVITHLGMMHTELCKIRLEAKKNNSREKVPFILPSFLQP